MSKLKILQITYRIPFPLNDGGNIAMWYNLHFLQQAGHQTFIAALNTNKHYQDPSVVANIAEVHAVPINTDIKVQDAIKNLFSPIPYVISRFWSAEFAQLLGDLCQKESFDIIQMEGSYLAMYLPAIRAATNSPVLLRAHNIEHEIWKRLSKDSNNLIKKFIFNQIYNEVKKFEQNQAIQFDGIVCISRKDEEFFLQHAQSTPKTTIPAGIDFKNYEIGVNLPKKNTICMLGSLEWQPNIDGLFWFLEEVWASVLSAKPAIELHIAGKNPTQKVLNIREPNVLVHGMVPDAQEFLKSYEVLIVPLFSGSGMRLKIVEALALGKCVISTAIGAEGIPYTDGKDILIANTPQEMKLAILKVIEDKTLRISIQEHARKLAEIHFDWRQLVKKFENFYSQFL